MKQVGSYNQLSEKFLEERDIKPLLPGQRKKFRSTKELLDPNDKTGKTVMYNVNGETIPPIDQVFDKHQGANGKMVDIGLINSVDKDGRPERAIKFQMKPDKRTGDFHLYGDREEDRYVYWYFQICNYNKNNPNRFTNKDAIFFEVDEDGEAKKIIRNRSKRHEVEKFVLDRGYGDLKKISLALGWGDSKSEDVMRRELLDFASNDPETFEKLITDTKALESLSVIKKAFDEGILQWNEVERKVTFAQNTVATLERVEGRKYHEQFDEYLKTTKTGDSIYQSIKKLVVQK